MELQDEDNVQKHIRIEIRENPMIGLRIQSQKMKESNPRLLESDARVK